MKEEKLNELLQLYVFDELEDSEKTEVEKYLESSESARSELEKIQNLFSKISKNRPAELNDDNLLSSRQNLLRQIRIEKSRESFLTKLRKWLEQVSVNGYKLAVSTASAAAVGILIGFFIFGTNNVSVPSDSNIKSVNIDQMIKSGSRLSNIRFDTDPLTGHIEISFDAVKPLTYDGNMNDDIVKHLLTAALLNNKNPGARLRTVNTIVEQTAAADQPDPKIKTALIKSLKSDSNPAVRKTALLALQNYKYDEEIRDAILYVLSNDTNSGLRVSAINVLSGLKTEGISIDDKIKNELNNQIENEKNGFIKYRAATLLQGED
jgi:hypothetical protein